MPKAKAKLKNTGMTGDDRGRSWTQREEDLLLEVWSREDVMSKMDGTVITSI